jgi:ssDNA-binding Zn-finger/Zn-ribbon topoisomerase 1
LTFSSDILEIINFYGLSCPQCGNSKLTTTINKQKQKVTVSCIECSNKWEGQRKLSEETGPRLAEILNITKNKGQWNPRWDMLEERADSTFRLLKGIKTKTIKKQNTITSQKKTAPKCPQCGADMRLIKPKSGERWQAFWGCTKYRQTGCRGSKKA